MAATQNAIGNDNHANIKIAKNLLLDLAKADKALTYFETIKEKYPNASEMAMVEVLIGKAKVLANKY